VPLYSVAVTRTGQLGVDIVCITGDFKYRTYYRFINSRTQRLGKSSTFGDVVADFARIRLAYHHMNLSDPRLRSSLLLKADQGEMMFSRDPRLLVTAPLYAAVVTGIFGVADVSAFVSLRLCRSDNGHIISAADFIVWREGDVNRLLGDLSIAGIR